MNPATLHAYASKAPDAATWYADAGRECARYARLVGTSPERVAGIFAATSPQASVAENTRRTVAYLTTGELPAFGGHRRLIERYEASGGFGESAPKVAAFYAALTGETGPSAMVVDTWMLQACGAAPATKGLNGLQYRRLAEYLSACAEDFGLSSPEYQARVWCAVRRERGNLGLQGMERPRFPEPFAYLHFGSADNGPMFTIGTDARRATNGRWYVRRNGSDYRARWYPVTRNGTVKLDGERARVTLLPEGNPMRVTVTTVSEEGA